MATKGFISNMTNVSSLSPQVLRFHWQGDLENIPVYNAQACLFPNRLVLIWLQRDHMEYLY
jgi:hypothetical protein